MRRYSYTLFLSVSLLVSVLFAKETIIFGKNDQTSGVSNGTERERNRKVCGRRDAGSGC